MATVKVAAICVLSADGGSGVSGVVQLVQNVGGKTSINIKVNRLQQEKKEINSRHIFILSAAGWRLTLIVRR